MTKPSWQDFGTHDESIVPELWDGVIGAWAPCLGPTGSRLHDMSRRANWGTLTNMDNATDWVVSDGQYALDFDGANDRVLATLRAVQSPPYSIASWIYVRTLNPTYTPWYVDDGAPLGREQEFFVNSTRTIGTGRVNVYNPVNSSVSTITLNAWQFVTVTFTANKTIAYYINGSDAGVSGTNPMTSQTVDLWTAHAICQSGRFASRSFDGLLAEQTIWSRTLSPNEIRQLYQLGRGGMYQRRRRSRIYLPQGGFQAAWARGSNVLLGFSQP